ncbi:hypothetical protein ISF_05969 [Cordyceps fumosorosea ARSEF 2679]|uniref:Uncharacterized protein n=1 Tax=Cordyceps fumosorosea (strain ARSEF 2679) TaxID=1081104 RepID=A0A167SV92_CORFA|nr:hypothetical protein ISF_05969 [Cordyceps fumosorosea ARSEF 2679]OAA59958.1 hypothetical protein ISF_05969 [Cordyceps fumosorosea ARSEF 2679]
MPSTILARATARRAATFCTSSRSMKPSADSHAGLGLGGGSSASTPAAGSSWAWRNLSPKTRQYVKLGAATCAATDAAVLYNYPGLVGLKKASE